MYPASQIIPSYFLDKTVHSWFEWQSGRVCRRPVFSVVIKVLISIVVVVIVLLLHVIVVVSTGDHLFGWQVVKISTLKKKNKRTKKEIFWKQDKLNWRLYRAVGKVPSSTSHTCYLGYPSLDINSIETFIWALAWSSQPVWSSQSVWSWCKRQKGIFDKRRMVAGSWRRCGLINQFVQSCLSLSVSTSSSSS